MLVVKIEGTFKSIQGGSYKDRVLCYLTIKKVSVHFLKKWRHFFVR